MELKSNVTYNDYYGTLKYLKNIKNDCENKGFPEEYKQQMLVDFPDWFEVMEPAVVTDPPEDSLTKTRKK